MLAKRIGRPQDFQILAFPCNQFKHQEPGDADTIRATAVGKYGFPGVLFEKIDVNGKGTHPVWTALKQFFPGKVKWNFEKFLLDRDGVPVKRYLTKTWPLEIEADVRRAMAKGA